MTTSTRYLSRTFLARFGLLIFTFLILFETVEMLTGGDDIISRNDSVLALFQYAALRIPEMVVQSVPFAVLLAALLTLAGLAQNNEIVVLKSAGVSFFQLLILMAPMGLLIGAAHFLLADQVVPRLAPRVEQLRHPDGREKEEEIAGSDRIWLRDGGAIVSIERASQDGRSLGDVSVFQRDDEGKLRSILQGQTGRFREGRWELYEVRVTTPGKAERDLPAMAWGTDLRPAQLSALAAHPSLLSVKRILRFVRNPEVGARPVHVYATWLQQRLTLFLEPLLMILLAAPAANLTRRRAGMAGALGYGIAMGFGFFVAEGLALAFGEAGKLPPVVAAWAPGAIFAASGGFVVLQFER